MRRQDIIKGIEQLLVAINTSNLSDLLRGVVVSPRDVDSRAKGRLLSGLYDYARQAADFSDSAKNIASLYKLEGLLEPTVWAQITNIETTESMELVNTLSYQLNATIRNLPIFSTIIQQTSAEEFQRDKPHLINADKLDVVSVIVVENDNRVSKPERLVVVFEAVSQLYNACLELTSDVPEQLGVLSCDSGSDKSFDFLGAAKAMQALKEILVQLYHAVAFRKEEKVTKQIKVIAEALPVLETIRRKEKEGLLSNDVAGRMSHNIVDSVCKLYESGIVIPEMTVTVIDSPRQIFTPETKMLTGSPSQAHAPIENITLSEMADSTSRETDPFANLTSAQKEEIMKIIGSSSSSSDDVDSAQAPTNESTKPKRKARNVAS